MSVRWRSTHRDLMVHNENMGASVRHNQHVDVAGTGFTVLDRIYTDGSLADESLGGSCGNVLLSLAMLNRQVAPVLALGDDVEGEQLVCEFISAGALTHYIHLRADLRSPVLAQELDTASGLHDFSFVCPETSADLPRYQPIGETELEFALPVLTHCSVFYADRLSESILEAMKTAWSAGAVVFFEPSDIDNETMFNEAMKMVSVLKYSVDRLGDRLSDISPRCIRIVTHGAAGLEVRHGTDAHWCRAVNAPVVLDTCGSGDMVSVGVIDWMISNRIGPDRLTAADLIGGVVAGQRLAAENCAYAGARGLFRKRGAGYVRRMLREDPSAA
ncbi:PfkB family carbohydrate kinase [Methylobacterium durans]|uniref:PfkB family carbohydrate kinase n=1 Tax=Methylobacterium durans TaxID=2202825 RepID=UPI002AFE1365|nr:PfkB family carbohydrate kinase [Methylobacterium durans]MEA1833427.1 PfkB family carbohydrate kinase [Methylobacterium durans]